MSTPVHTERFLAIIAVPNGWAVYAQVPGYSYAQDTKPVPLAVFNEKTNLLEWLRDEWVVNWDTVS